MFETMRFTWNMGIPWRGTPSEALPDVAFREVIEMATLNGVKALGIGDATGSLTVGKRADIILIRCDQSTRCIAPSTRARRLVLTVPDVPLQNPQLRSSMANRFPKDFF